MFTPRPTPFGDANAPTPRSIRPTNTTEEDEPTDYSWIQYLIYPMVICAYFIFRGLIALIRWCKNCCDRDDNEYDYFYRDNTFSPEAVKAYAASSVVDGELGSLDESIEMNNKDESIEMNNKEKTNNDTLMQLFNSKTTVDNESCVCMSGRPYLECCGKPSVHDKHLAVKVPASEDEKAEAEKAKTDDELSSDHSYSYSTDQSLNHSV